MQNADYFQLGQLYKIKKNNGFSQKICIAIRLNKNQTNMDGFSFLHNDSLTRAEGVGFLKAKVCIL